MVFATIILIITAFIFIGINVDGYNKDKAIYPFWNYLLLMICCVCCMILGKYRSEHIRTKTVPTIEYEIHQINDVSDTTYIYHFNLNNTD